MQDSYQDVDDENDETAILDSGGSTPTANQADHDQRDSAAKSQLPRLSSSNLAGTTVHDVSVDVVISPLARRVAGAGNRPDKNALFHSALQANMIVSVWCIEDTQYYTLTFTSAVPTKTAVNSRPSSRIVHRTSTGLHLNKSRSSGSSSSSGQRSGANSSSNSKAATPTFQQVDFPPRGPPINTQHDISASASIFQKASQLKDALLNALTMPAYGLSKSCLWFNSRVTNSAISDVERRKLWYPE